MSHFPLPLSIKRVNFPLVMCVSPFWGGPFDGAVQIAQSPSEYVPSGETRISARSSRYKAGVWRFTSQASGIVYAIDAVMVEEAVKVPKYVHGLSISPVDIHTASQILRLEIQAYEQMPEFQDLMMVLNMAPSLFERFAKLEKHSEMAEAIYSALKSIATEMDSYRRAIANDDLVAAQHNWQYATMNLVQCAVFCRRDEAEAWLLGGDKPRLMEFALVNKCGDFIEAEKAVKEILDALESATARERFTWYSSQVQTWALYEPVKVLGFLAELGFIE